MLVTSLAAASLPARAQSVEKPDLSISMGGWGITYLPLTVADTKGFLKKEGVNAKVEDFNRGGTQALQSLIGGATDMVLGFYDHTIQMQAQGKHIRCVVLLGQLTAASLAVRSDLADQIHSAADFKGKRIGVPSLGSSGEFLVRYIMKRAGVSAADYTLVPIGAQGTAIAAIEHKDVDGLMASDPAQTVMEDKGLIKVMLDGRTVEGSKQQYGGNYPAACLYTTEAFLLQNPVTVQHVVNAMVATLAWLKTASPDEVVAALPPAYVLGGPKAFAAIYAHYGQVYPDGGRFNPPDLERVRDVLASFNDQVRDTKIDMAATYTNQFVDRALRPQNDPVASIHP